jgi:hypothetical protein
MAAISSIVPLVSLIGALPRWCYGRRWGSYPTSGFSLSLIVATVLLLTGRL